MSELTRLLQKSPANVAEVKQPIRSYDERPQFLILDLARVNSLDASAVHSCFIPVSRLTAGLDIKLVFAGARDAVQSQLLKHGVFGGDHIQSYATVHMALGWCESVILKVWVR